MQLTERKSQQLTETDTEVAAICIIYDLLLTVLAQMLTVLDV